MSVTFCTMGNKTNKLRCASVLDKKMKTAEGDRTTFRVTCTRTGTKHTVTSMEVAKHFGSGVSQLFGWKVKLVHPDIEVLLSITDSNCLISVSLTQDSRHLRNISHFGPTTLRSTIAYGLVRSMLKPLYLNKLSVLCSVVLTKMRFGIYLSQTNKSATSNSFKQYLYNEVF